MKIVKLFFKREIFKQKITIFKDLLIEERGDKDFERLSEKSLSFWANSQDDIYGNFYK